MPESPDVATLTASVVYRADTVDAWMVSARRHIERLRGQLEEATRRAEAAERQVRLMADGEQEIVGAAQRGRAGVAACGGSEQAHRHADELIAEARRSALAVLARGRRRIATLYRSVGSPPSRFVATGAEPDGSDVDRANVVEGSAGPSGLRRYGVYQTNEAADYMQAARDVAKSLQCLVVEATTRAQRAEDRFETGAASTVGGVHEPEGGDVHADVMPADVGPETEAVLAEGKQGAQDILATARRVVAAMYRQAEKDLLGASATVQVLDQVDDCCGA